MSDTTPGGLLFILCGPSGVGKTTLARHLLDRHENLTFSVSYTTRAPRGSEVNGVDYNFVTPAEFDRMRSDAEFAEWAEVHGNRYGTAVARVEEAWAAGKNVIFDIDYQGARQLRERFGIRAIVVLVSPPSMAALEGRLRGRKTDSEEVIARRLRAAQVEISALERFADHRLVNEDIDAACDEIDAIYRATAGTPP